MADTAFDKFDEKNDWIFILCMPPQRIYNADVPISISSISMSLNFFIPLALVSVSRNWFTFSSRAFYQYMSLKMGYEHANIFEEEHFNYSQNMWPVEGRHKCGWFIVYIPARITLVVSVYSVNLRYYPVWSWLSLFLNFTSILSTNSWCLQSIILQTCSYKCLLYNSHNTMTTYMLFYSSSSSSECWVGAELNDGVRRRLSLNIEWYTSFSILILILLIHTTSMFLTIIWVCYVKS